MKRKSIIFLLLSNSNISRLAKVSDRNSFRANQNYSDSFRYLYPIQCESFQTNPKIVLYLVWCKTVKKQFVSIQFNLRHQSKWIRTNTNKVFNPNQSKFGIIQTEFSNRINSNESEIGMIRMDSDWKLGLDKSELGLNRTENFCPSVSEPFRTNPKNVSDLIRFKSNSFQFNLQLQSEWIQMDPSSYWSKPNFLSKSIQMNLKSERFRQKIRFGLIRHC